MSYQCNLWKVCYPTRHFSAEMGFKEVAATPSYILKPKCSPVGAPCFWRQISRTPPLGAAVCEGEETLAVTYWAVARWYVVLLHILLCGAATHRVVRLKGNTFS